MLVDTTWLSSVELLGRVITPLSERITSLLVAEPKVAVEVAAFQLAGT